MKARFVDCFRLSKEAHHFQTRPRRNWQHSGIKLVFATTFWKADMLNADTEAER